jgi:predicted dehydrogenase
MSGPTKVGVIGAGDISGEYLSSMTGYPDLSVVAVTDLDQSRARARAQQFGIGFSASPAELLAREDVELIVNLTPPAAHTRVGLAAVEAGKHVWGEKPLALDRDAGRALLAAADRNGVVVGSAPDTILGEGIQNSHRLLNDGAIGTPRTVLTLMQGPGPDAWHPRPQFLFARGGGPLFDIGPYYLSTLVQLLGEIESVQATGHRPRTERVIGSGPDAGTAFPVEVYTHVSVLTRFRSGVVGTSIYSFDSAVRRQSFEVSGSAGTMAVPVSGFDGPTRILAGGSDEWRTVAPPGVHRERGVGVLEMARAIRAGRPPRAGGALALHVLDAMLAVEESIDKGTPVPLSSGADGVPTLETGWDPHQRTW